MIRNGKASGIHQLVLEKVNMLSKDKGYCFASNHAIAKMLDRHEDRISHIIGELVDAGLLLRKLVFSAERRNIVKERFLWIAEGVEIFGSQRVATFDKEQESMPLPDPETLDHLAVITANKLGIATAFVLKMIRSFGVQYVLQKINIVAASNAVNNATGYFIMACVKNYKVNSRSQKLISNNRKPAPALNRTFKQSVAQLKAKIDRFYDDPDFMLSRDILASYGLI